MTVGGSHPFACCVGMTKARPVLECLNYLFMQWCVPIRDGTSLPSGEISSVNVVHKIALPFHPLSE